MTRREGLRAAQPTGRCGPVSNPATEDLPALSVSHLSTWRNCSIRCAPARLCSHDSLATRPCCAPSCVSADHDRVRAFPAQDVGLSRATPRPLGPLRRLRLKIQVLELRRPEDHERRAWDSHARLQVSRPAGTHDRDRSPPSLTRSDQPLARDGLTTAACYDTHTPASDAVLCLTAARCIVGRLRGPIGIRHGCMWQWGNVTTDGRASGLRGESVDGRVGVRMSSFLHAFVCVCTRCCARLLARAGCSSLEP